tara:strand:+ start:313 stop:657 length:345 start_codon:yes stop_codon:yes gene_type:complete
MDNVENLENTEQDNNTNHIQDLIKASLEKDYNHANKIFGEVMTIKMSDLLDQEKVKMADQVYNGVPEEEEPIPEDEDLKDDTEEDEEEVDSEEPTDDEEEEEEEEEEEIEGAAV